MSAKTDAVEALLEVAAGIPAQLELHRQAKVAAAEKRAALRELLDVRLFQLKVAGHRMLDVGAGVLFPVWDGVPLINEVHSPEIARVVKVAAVSTWLAETIKERKAKEKGKTEDKKPEEAPKVAGAALGSGNDPQGAGIHEQTQISPELLKWFQKSVAGLARKSQLPYVLATPGQEPQGDLQHAGIREILARLVEAKANPPAQTAPPVMGTMASPGAPA